MRLLIVEIWAVDLFLTRGQIGLSSLPALLAGLCLRPVLALGPVVGHELSQRRDRVDVEVALAGQQRRAYAYRSLAFIDGRR
jgi:hypothetical protein